MLAGNEKSCDPNMASLSTLIDKFLIENKCHPEYHKGLEADMALWVVKCSNIEVHPSVDDGGSELTMTGVGTASGWMVERCTYDRFWVLSDTLDVVRQELQDAKTRLMSPRGALPPMPRRIDSRAAVGVAGPSQTNTPTKEAVMPRQLGR